jgi:hypothetical protein
LPESTEPTKISVDGTPISMQTSGIIHSQTLAMYSLLLSTKPARQDENVQGFKPRQDWSYIYASLHPFSYSTEGSSFTNVEPSVAIFPAGNAHKIRHKGSMFVFGVNGKFKSINDAIWPKFAAIRNVKAALVKLGRTPLKLVVAEKWPNEDYWQSSLWPFSKSAFRNHIIEGEGGFFEFSIANEKSNQDIHFHKNAFELFVSDKRIHCDYERSQTIQSLTACGTSIVIIPPVIKHIVLLGGLTFVFQVTRNRSSMNGDKVHCDGFFYHCVPPRKCLEAI